MPQAPDSMQPTNPNPQPGMGFSEQPHPFWKALEGVVSGLRNLQMSGNQQPWGMHEPTVTAGAGVQQGLQGANQVMSDPRNAWIGMGPVAGMALMGRGIRGVGKVAGDLGGFNVPTAAMRPAVNMPRPNLRMGEVPGGDSSAVRDTFMGNLEGLNKMSSVLMDPSHPQQGQMHRVYDMLPMEEKQHVIDTINTQQELQQQLLKAKQGVGGGEESPLGYGQ